MKRIPGADGIRGLACLIVLALHAVAFNFPDTLQYFRGIPKVGVWLFFVLSAYLLTRQFLSRGYSGPVLADYFIARTFRIYPLFALAVLASYWLGNVGIDTPRDVWRALTFQQGYAQLWTIPVEFKFYFALPLIVSMASMIHRRAGLAGLGIVTGVFTAAHQAIAPYWLVNHASISTFAYLPAFLFGVVAAFADGKRRNADRIGLTILAAMTASAPGIRSLLFGVPLDDAAVDKYLFYSFAWAIFIVTQTASRGMLARILNGKALGRIGEWSYSIYLAHILIIIKLWLAFPGSIAALVASLVLSVVAGWALHATLERPLGGARRSVASWLNARRNSQSHRL